MNLHEQAFLAEIIHGFPVAVSSHMAGMKKAVKMGGVVYVSPAILSLIRSETGSALEHLLRNLPLLDLDRAPGAIDFRNIQIPITTR